MLDEEESAIGSRVFTEDRWELFNLSEDFSEGVDRASEEPARLRQLTELWTAEAERNQVFPISDGMLDRLSGLIPPTWPVGSSRTFLPGGGPVHDESIPPLWGGFSLAAEVDAVGSGTEGVVCALGDWFGGYALYVVDSAVNFTFSRAGDALHLQDASPLVPGRHTLTVSYAVGQGGDPGTMELAVDGAVIDRLSVTGMLPLALQHGGAGLRLGYDSGFAVSPRYTPPANFSGVVHFVSIETPGAAVPRLDDEVRTALHGD